MKIEFEGGTITIDDTDARAIKIKQGYSYSVKDGKLITGKKTEYDLTNFETKMATGIATSTDINNFIKELISIYKQIKFGEK